MVTNAGLNVTEDLEVGLSGKRWALHTVYG